MKKISLLSLIMLLSGMFMFSAAQDCTPDEAVVDTGNPGEVVVLPLPNAIQYDYYDYTVTVIPPATSNGVDIYSIIIDSVVGLPPGINWYKNEEEFFVTDPDTRYCVNLYGEPTEQGEFPLTLYITPYIDIYGTPIEGDQAVDDSSMSIFVDAPVGLPEKIDIFDAKLAFPNPFSKETRIEVESVNSGNAKLQVYNVLGNLVYKENLFASQGVNRFQFTGRDLCAGTYIYTIQLNGKKETFRLMKAR
ncbi:MAG: T9SS type A sorting domain-containing protein [Bacteroidota bacterium]|nr:T9SS type A sorting domain-containing protein [Bacteroidota bacterium]